LEIDKRVEQINSFEYSNYPALIPTQIEIKENSLEYSQKYYPKVSITLLQKKDFFEIAKALEYFESVGFIHGDINRKNIIYTTDGFKIIDYEPSLEQIKDGFAQKMTTIPYIAKSGIITTDTDKIGFFYFILRVMRRISSQKIAKLTKKFEHSLALGIEESQIYTMRYKDIIDFIL
jgi:serine/threonine protein kinase